MKNIFKRKKAPPEEPTVLSFLDCITPGVLKFETDHYISGNTWRCVWALREYPAATDSQALLGRLGDRRGVTLRIVCRLVTPAEENRIIHNATNRNKLERANTNDLRRVITAESNLQDMASLVGALDREHEPLLYCAVYVEVIADSFENLKLLQTSVEAELVRCKLTIDKLVLRQQQGFLTVNPAGCAALGPQFQRVLPASSVANLFPFNYSGKADPNGFYIGKDKFGSNIVVDFDRRESDKTSANILILGNSGQGKSYLMKLLICNLIESGKSVISLDAEHEFSALKIGYRGDLAFQNAEVIDVPRFLAEGITQGEPVQTNAELRDALFQRIEQEQKAYTETLYRMTQSELIANAGEIEATRYCYNALFTANLERYQMLLLLSDGYPLTCVRDAWQTEQDMERDDEFRYTVFRLCEDMQENQQDLTM